MKFCITFAQAKTHVDEFIFYMQSRGYKKSTQKITAQNIKLFLKSVEDEQQLLTEESIYGFVAQRYDRESQHSRYNSVLGSCRRFFYYLRDGNFSSTRHVTTSVSLPENLEIYIDAFIVEQSAKNCEITLSRKRKTLTSFALYLSKHGVNDFTELDVTIILTYLQDKTPETGRYIRAFLSFMFAQQLIKQDFSVLVNIIKRPRKLPTVYSEEELNLLIKVFDGDDLISKRNRAIVLLAATTGLRSCDIVGLKYSDFSFEKGCVCVVQAKTGVQISLPINEETSSAVRGYYASRPSSDFTNLFINQNAPFRPVSTGIIRYILRNAFLKANIDTTGKKHGPHSLRSSLASAMVNSGMPYEIVQRQLGHTSDDSLNSYVKLDIEKLRFCALETLPATGNFKFWLEGSV